MPIFTSRGCPFHCTFCHDLFTKTFRGRSPDHIVQEILLLHREYEVDEFLIYVAPKLLGQGRELAAFGPLQSLAEGLALRFISATPLGADLRIMARPLG